MFTRSPVAPLGVLVAYLKMLNVFFSNRSHSMNRLQVIASLMLAIFITSVAISTEAVVGALVATATAGIPANLFIIK
jgi:hypothetical protein